MSSNEPTPRSAATSMTEQLEGDEVTHIRRFRLEVIGGPDAGTVFTSRGRRTVVGSHRSADLVLTDNAVSRFHFEVEIEQGRVRLRDQQSLNGTRVAGVRVLDAVLEHSCVVSAGRSELRFELRDEQTEITVSRREQFGVLRARSVAMRAVFALLERAAPSNATVLLSGETGTGKDAAADAIHQESARSRGPLVVVDCGAIPANLLESELFGHEVGAFTGAERARRGAFEQANGGTLFLDEVGELDLDLQPKLLRAIEQRVIRPVGSEETVDVDVRVIAATNRNLRAEVNAGRFRSDLYYRLAVVEVTMPPLRERPEDIPLLVGDILERMGRTDDEGAALLQQREALAELVRHPWPGNIRELRNYVERSLALHTRVPLADELSPMSAPEIDVTRPFREMRDDVVRFAERRYLEEILARHDDNVTAAARSAGIDRVYFHRLLSRHGLR